VGKISQNMHFVNHFAQIEQSFDRNFASKYYGTIYLLMQIDKTPIPTLSP
jgi:hypothetical protein